MGVVYRSKLLPKIVKIVNFSFQEILE